MKSDRFERGSKIINSLIEGGEQGVLKGLGKTAPDLANYVLEFIFGDLYSRPGLDLKTKQMLTITILATLGNAKPQLGYHINAALNIGISRQEIVDIMTHVAGYAGFPAALNGIATAKEIFSDRDQKGLDNN
ncbi:carboxymuconolactone decarboxylase family protein [Legionella jamestowniensis]|uniref:Carboxymuconolactone decarboxylase family protein n=1 Tax=Legionella jamestowniensis TaxID=455 RepID=A0A0W0UKU3_9GAMM|nr:carboxymuconolactone decarboxylase family protein [Legionella jamestowniensis]KTD08528.1 Carboxymuconolactone decarboxylase family protein [Legionella jamestowniensis]SFL52439.1 4-carboxymuconolactone decarboxylase [Legionella jamestowniensis DSM 19215]